MNSQRRICYIQTKTEDNETREGSGVLLCRYKNKQKCNIIVTCRHIIENYDQIKIWYGDHGYNPNNGFAVIVDSTKLDSKTPLDARDLVILKLEEKSAIDGFEEFTEITENQKFSLWGYPLGEKFFDKQDDKVLPQQEDIKTGHANKKNIYIVSNQPRGDKGISGGCVFDQDKLAGIFRGEWVNGEFRRGVVIGAYWIDELCRQAGYFPAEENEINCLIEIQDSCFVVWNGSSVVYLKTKVDYIEDIGLKISESLQNYVQNPDMEKLQTLARHGHDLFQTLFAANSFSTQNAKKSYDELQRASFGDRLKIVNNNLSLPWNCIYQGNPQQKIDPKLFWGNRYKLYVLTQDQVENISEIKVRSGIFYYGCNMKYPRSIRKNLQNIAQDFEGKPIKIDTPEELCNLIENSVPDILVIYDNINWQNSYFAINQSQRIFPKDIQGKLSRNTFKNKKPFVFFIACDANAKNLNFRQLFIQNLTWQGMVSVEGCLPEDFAMEFSLRFFKELLNKTNVPTILHKLRKEYWQNNSDCRGLIFTAYCPGDTRGI